MPQTLDSATERTALLYHAANAQRLEQLTSSAQQHEEEESIERGVSMGMEGAVDKEEEAMGVNSTVGERLPYNDYATIDWLHDLVNLTFPFS
jgi:chloride channel 3/4/5